MHTIKFRGKSLSTGEWVYGYYYATPLHFLDKHDVITHCIIDTEGSIYRVDHNTVGQYIWKKDKNGKEAYIGDICKSFFGDNIGIIEWHKTNPWIVLRYVDSRNGMYSFDHLSLEAFEIIGNLTDNPDLLTQ